MNLTLVGKVCTHRCPLLKEYSSDRKALCDEMKGAEDARCLTCDGAPMIELARPSIVGKDGRFKGYADALTEPLARLKSVAPSKPDAPAEHVAEPEASNTDDGKPCPKPSHGGRKMDGNGECSYCRKYRRKDEKKRELNRIAREAAAKGKAKVAERSARRAERKAEHGNQAGRLMLDEAVVIPTEAINAIREKMGQYDAAHRLAANFPGVIDDAGLERIKNTVALDIGLALIEARETITKET